MENNISVQNTVSASSSLCQWPQGQVRIVFDGDGVLFSDEAECIAKTQGLQAFLKFEQERGHIPLPKGPMQAFALKLQKVCQALGENNQWRIRTFLVTARNDVANLRVFHTLKEWGLDINETHFLGGLDKTPFLRAIDPAIFFDDSSENINRAKLHIPSAHVLYGIRSIGKTIGTVLSITELSLENDDEEQHIVGTNTNQQWLNEKILKN
ncbi:unnamed protein product [Rotaria sp. Silwood1]|nr:unnamed protein product [Rotaria sp. Silwood1]CAF4036812.1 unnamed protein product [Rotaria sp. Silwood1]CAF4627968.1 unnamed protein product [Rotaria sp. Silwood1]